MVMTVVSRVLGCPRSAPHADRRSIALCMAVERAENPPEPVQLLGWI
jgi:hypothetical protein